MPSTHTLHTAKYTNAFAHIHTHTNYMYTYTHTPGPGLQTTFQVMSFCYLYKSRQNQSNKYHPLQYMFIKDTCALTHTPHTHTRVHACTHTHTPCTHTHSMHCPLHTHACTHMHSTLHTHACIHARNAHLMPAWSLFTPSSTGYALIRVRFTPHYPSTN